MKKITFILSTLLVSTIGAFSQSIAITAIEGQAPNDYFASTTPATSLNINEPIDVTVTYTDLPENTSTPGMTEITVRRVNNAFSAAFDATVEAVTSGSGTATISFTPTEEDTDFHLQAFAFNHPATSLTETYFFNVDVVDPSSLVFDNKSKLSGYSYNATTDILTMSSSADYIVYSITGAIVSQGSSNEISFANLVDGIYIISSTNGRTKLVKN